MMNSSGHFFRIVLAVLLFSALPPFRGHAADTVRVGGTGGVLAVMKKLAAAFQRDHPGISVSVLPSLGSSGGIKAVLAGALDVGLSSRPPSGKEQGLESRELARTAFVFAVQKDNPVAGLSLKEAQAIYSGATVTWPDGRPLRLVLRPAAEYDTALLKEISPAMDRAVTKALSRDGMITAVTDQDNATALVKVPGTVGTMTMGQLLAEGLPLKPLAFQGQQPCTDSLSCGKYAPVKSYYVITKPSARQPVRAFVDFVHSAQGSKILSQYGYCTSR